MVSRGSKVGNVKCFYHDDLDGFCSGAIVQLKYPHAKCMKIDYGDSFDWNSIDKTDTVFMVDFGLQPFDEMLKLNQMCNLIWIDHHDTALTNQEKSGIKLQGLQRLGSAGCELTWEYLFPNESMPRFVSLLGDYDEWRNQDKEKWNNEVMPFEYAMQGYSEENLQPNSHLWLELDDEKINKIIENGKTIIGFLTKYNKEATQKYAYTIELEGFKFLCLNTPHRGSFLVESTYKEDKYDGVMIWRYNGNNCTFSFYTTKDNVHVGNIAQKYGGGGCAKAAGGSMTPDEFHDAFKMISKKFS